LAIWGHCCGNFLSLGTEPYQAEAFDPVELVRIVEGAIAAHLDRAAYAAVLVREEQVRQAALARLNRF
jgi:hypothetical protein